MDTISAEQAVLIAAAVSAAGTLLGGCIAAVAAAWVAKLQFRASVVSASRQKWLDDLRLAVAAFKGHAQLASNPAVWGLSVTEQMGVFAGLNLEMAKAELLLNSNEASHKEVVDALRGVILAIRSVPDDLDPFALASIRLTQATQYLLKQEWEKAKLGK